jgi:hypothetical protein
MTAQRHQGGHFVLVLSAAVLVLGVVIDANPPMLAGNGTASAGCPSFMK